MSIIVPHSLPKKPIEGIKGHTHTQVGDRTSSSERLEVRGHSQMETGKRTALRERHLTTDQGKLKQGLMTGHQELAGHW